MTEKYLTAITTRENYEHEATRSAVEQHLMRSVPHGAQVLKTVWHGTDEMERLIWGDVCRLSIIYTEGTAQ